MLLLSSMVLINGLCWLMRSPGKLLLNNNFSTASKANTAKVS